MDICKLCGEEKKNLGVHLRHKHQMSQEDYNKIMIDSDSMTNELETAPIPDEAKPQPSLTGTVEGGPTVKVSEDTPEPKEDRREVTEDMTLGEYCTRKNIDLAELNKIVNKFTHGAEEDAATMAEHRANEGVKNSEELKSEDEIKTHDLAIAEALVKVHKTHEVISVKSGPPKVYVLKRKGA